MKKQKLQKDRGQKTEQSKLSVTDHVFVFSDLLLVYPILNNTTSYTVQHLTQLGVAVQIAEKPSQFAGRLTLFMENWEKNMHRPVGPRCSSRVPDRVVGATTSVLCPNAPSILQ